ncbi:hypothetical protein TWF696_008184 [Orbilia brochopaga]|uniref:F-box domain-containing protein n=1 Tax=Orbilia brochopaga TaxID=3140254 RepID=A0AAV9UMT1_9PEZI
MDSADPFHLPYSNTIANSAGIGIDVGSSSTDIDPHGNRSSSNTLSLRSRISNRARSTIIRVLDLREPPPKRNDTPLNFTDTIPLGDAFLSQREDSLDRTRRPPSRQEPRHQWLGPTSASSGVHSWFARLRNSSSTNSADKGHPHRPAPGKPVNVPHDPSPRRSSAGNHITKDKDKSVSNVSSGNGHRLSTSGPRKVLGSLIPNGLGTILNGVGNNKNDRTVGIDIMTVFPAEIIAQIFSHLDHQSLLSCELVSRSWWWAAMESQVWKQAFERKYGMWEGNPYGRDWKAMFEAKATLDRRWLKGQVSATYLKGHTDSVYCLQFDQSKIVTGSRDRTVRVWDIATGKCTHVIGGDTPREGAAAATVGYHRGSVLCLQFDESILVTGSSDHTCIVYSIADGWRPVVQLPGHRMGVLDVCFDERHIVSCSKDATICVWDRQAGLLLNRLRGHEGPVNAVQLRGKLVASASGDANVKLWDVETGMCLRTLSGHTRGLACIQLSEDCRTLASGGNDQTIRVWDVETGKLRYEIREAHKSLVRSLDLDSENGRIISGSYDQSVRVWDLATGRSLLNFPRWHASWVLAARGDWRRIVSTGQDAQVLVLDFAGGLRRLSSMQ